MNIKEYLFGERYSFVELLIIYCFAEIIIFLLRHYV
jgi:hypothetical protein